MQLFVREYQRRFPLPRHLLQIVAFSPFVSGRKKVTTFRAEKVDPGTLSAVNTGKEKKLGARG